MATELKLDNVEDRARMAPDTFEIPSKPQRENLEPGQLVKLVFLTGLENPTGERMWVQILSRKDTGGVRYEGEISNDPAFIDALFGDIVHFGPEHIANIYED